MPQNIRNTDKKRINVGETVVQRQPTWRNGLARWTSKSKVVGSSFIGGEADLSLLMVEFLIWYCFLKFQYLRCKSILLHLLSK